MSGRPDRWALVPKTASIENSISSHIAPTIIAKAKAQTASIHTSPRGRAPPVPVMTSAMPNTASTADATMWSAMSYHQRRT